MWWKILTLLKNFAPEIVPLIPRIKSLLERVDRHLDSVERIEQQIVQQQRSISDLEAGLASVHQQLQVDLSKLAASLGQYNLQKLERSQQSCKQMLFALLSLSALNLLATLYLILHK